MTCKDCIHYELCQHHIDEETSLSASRCRRFKNKADFVEVVRCKDCTEWDEKECECSHWYGFRENDFCSYGEKR